MRCTRRGQKRHGADFSVAWRRCAPHRMPSIASCDYLISLRVSKRWQWRRNRRHYDMDSYILADKAARTMSTRRSAGMTYDIKESARRAVGRRNRSQGGGGNESKAQMRNVSFYRRDVYMYRGNGHLPPPQKLAPARKQPSRTSAPWLR